MTNFFVDTSALGKCYLTEPSSTWVLSWISPTAGNVVVISKLAEVELLSVLSRRHRNGTLPATTLNALMSQFSIHLEKEYASVLLDEHVIKLDGQLTIKHPLRTLDAIQLASALQAVNSLGEPLTFISGDSNLLNAALAEGFTTDNPYSHP